MLRVKLYTKVLEKACSDVAIFVKRSFLFAAVSGELSPINLSPPPSLPQTRITPSSTFYGPNLLLTLLWKTPMLCVATSRALEDGGWIGCVCLWEWDGETREVGRGERERERSKWYKSVEIEQFQPTTRNKREHNTGPTCTVHGEL